MRQREEKFSWSICATEVKRTELGDTVLYSPINQ
jgi:hypothetical protein